MKNQWIFNTINPEGDTLWYVGRPWLHRWPCAAVSHSLTCARENMLSQQVWSTGRTASQQEKNGGHDLDWMLQQQSCLMTRPLPSTETFTYLRSIVRQDGGTNEDIQSRLRKDRHAFRSLNAVWRSLQYSIKTKLKLYHSCVLSTLLCGSECWRMTEHDLAKLSSFHMTSLWKIQCIF